MRKILATLIIASLLSATTVAPSFAGGYECNPFWPVAAALTTAAIIGSVANAAAPSPVVYGYGAPPATVVYTRPAAYYAPRPYYAPAGYYAARGYAAPRGYYAPRAHYPYRGYRVYR
jgi:hypothetical protein